MTPTTTPTQSYYQRTGGNRYQPTAHAGGAWNAEEHHFGPLAGLVVHALDRHRAARSANGLVLARISYDILGFLALDECEITVESIRPGRTVELLEAVVATADRPAVRARAWFLTALDTTAVADTPFEGLPPPGTFTPWAMSDLWDCGYARSLHVRRRASGRAGRAAAWVTSDVGLVADEPSSALASFVARVDVVNGMAVQQPPTKWTYPNVDMTLHFHRRPEGRWTGLDTTVSFGPAGHGLTSAVLHDANGPVGHAQQILTVRPLEGSHR
ncbi:thioesterase family protein [Streptomyces sp. NPDC002574]|uniref:thioesterase family protein n=1 Tax=Streptomyces sp. NPDC002574 TaxID=3364652 RepID=UPI0036994761